MPAPSASGVVNEWILPRTHKSRARPMCPSLTDLCLVSSSGPQGARLREREARGSSRRHRTVRCPKEAAEGATGGKAKRVGQVPQPLVADCPPSPVVQ